MIETQAYFSNIKEVIIQQINGAQKSIFVAVAWFTDDDLYDALMRKKNQGIDIELIIMDDKINQNSGLDYKALVNKGINLWFFPDGKATMHHKFCLIDEKIALTGSYNWTRKAALHNSETLLIMPLTTDLFNRFVNEFTQVKQIAKAILPAKKEKNETYNIETTQITQYGIDLKLAIQLLQAEIAALETEKSFWENAIASFERELRLRIQSVLLRYFELQERLAALKTKFSQKFADKENYENHKKNYQNFQHQLNDDNETKKKTLDLSENEEVELKKLFREAIFMSHPDRFSGDAEKEAQANKITAALNEAYKIKDLAKVREIWQALKDGVAFELELENLSTERLQGFYEKLLKQRDELWEAMSILRKHELYDVILNKTNIDDFASDKKVQIELKISILQKEIKEYE